jgi:hypothetical protein
MISVRILLLSGADMPCERIQPTGLGYFTFPDNKHAPARQSERLVIPSIPFDVVSELLLPKASICSWHYGVPAGRVRVPEAPADLNHCSVTRKDNIGTAGQLRVMESISESLGVQESTYQQFRLRILAPNTGHHPTSGTPIDDIRHAAAQSRPRR